MSATDSAISSASKPKYAGIAGKLRQRVRGMEPGTKFQSVRGLMREFEASQATIYSALDLLKKEGLVIHEQGRGLRVPRTDRQMVSNALLMVAERATSPFHQSLVFALCQRARSHRLRFFVDAFPPHETPDQPWPPTEASAGLLIPGRTTLTPELISAWRNRQLPLVVMNRDLRDIGVDSIDTDHYRGGQLAARHLLELGHRELAVILHQPDSFTLSRRVQGFRDAVNDAGARVRVHAASQPIDGAELEPFVRYTLTEHPEATALFALTHSSAAAALHALQHLDRQAPRDISLLGYDHLGRLTNPNLTTIDQRWTTWPRPPAASSACGWTATTARPCITWANST